MYMLTQDLQHPDGKTDAMPLDVASVFEPSDL